MKVLTHEADSLSADRRRGVNALKKAHYRLCCEQVETLKQVRKPKGLNTRLAVLSLFGMMNWIYTWHRADVHPDGETMARRMVEIFLRGVLAWAPDARGRSSGDRFGRSAHTVSKALAGPARSVRI